MLRKPKPGGDIDKTQQPNRAVHQKTIDRLLRSFGFALKNVIEESRRCAQVIEKIVDTVSDPLRKYGPVANSKRAKNHPVHCLVEREHGPVERLQRIWCWLG